jgi:photosystem II stability/assembly factor-like uncharacterized protein
VPGKRGGAALADAGAARDAKDTKERRGKGKRGGKNGKAALDVATLKALEWRPVGPFRGGRVVAVAGDPERAQVFYFGSTGGGVWKTTDGGVFWQNVSDGYFKRASVGAIAVAQADPNVIYVGMGETTIRGNVSHGDGVYRSTDGGRTWMHLGLAETRNIAKVRVHPRDPDLVYVAALGHAHGPNPERGVYRSRDGGRTWEQLLFRSEKAGAIDLAMDPNNPRILYAAFWEAHRGPHYLNSGGPDSSLYRSTDGGDSWTEITRAKGLPKGVLGKIGLAVSPAREGRVWAIVEAEDGAVFRSDDGGESWERLSEDRNLRQRAWYYHHIYADPQDPETVWVLNVECWKSTDGGATFSSVPVPHGDNHDLWIDPRDPQRMIEGNDGGGTVTFNGGETWSNIYNQPTAEFYHVTADNQVPYRLYGAQQDNTTISVASRSPLSGITRSDWYEIGGGESGYIAVRPDDPNIVYAGSYLGFVTRYDHRTGQTRNIMVWPEMTLGAGAKEAKYRFQWTAPIVLSPHDPNELYVTGNHVFRSRDEGASWEIISPDLTRNDPTRLESSGGPITQDNTGAEYYCTVFAFAESPAQRGILWAGSDDGLVHVSRDGGATWENVTAKGKDLPEWALISIVEPSPHDPATAYVAATRYKHDDFAPYLYKTNDYGKTWRSITNGIPEDDFTRVIREDPERQGLLYAGTETGVYVSFDDGANWQRLQNNLPVVPIHDLVVKDGDLVLATHGRSFWILDDLTPLRELAGSTANGARLFRPRRTIRFKTARGFGHPPARGKSYRMTGATMVAYTMTEQPTGEKTETYLDAGRNPPDGVVVYYALPERPQGEVKLTFLDAAGQEIKTFTSKPDEEEKGKQDTGESAASAPATTTPAVAGEAHESPLEQATGTEQDEAEEEGKEPRVPKEAGLNRFVWNMRYPEATKVKDDKSMEFVGGVTGPVAPPGTYQVRLTVGDETLTESFELARDARTGATDEDLRAQFELLCQIRDKLSETHDAINELRSIRQQVEEWERRAKGQLTLAAVATAAKGLKEKLTAVEEELIQVKAKSRQDTLNYPLKLNAKLAGVAGVVASADAAPTRQAHEVFADLSARIDQQLIRLREVTTADVAEFNRLVRESEIPAILPRTKEVKTGELATAAGN